MNALGFEGKARVKLVPDNELWLHEPEARRDLEQALAWAKLNPPQSRARLPFR